MLTKINTYFKNTLEMVTMRIIHLPKLNIQMNILNLRNTQT